MPISSKEELCPRAKVASVWHGYGKGTRKIARRLELARKKSLHCTKKKQQIVEKGLLTRSRRTGGTKMRKKEKKSRVNSQYFVDS